MATPELIDLLRKPNLNVREYVEEVLRANREAGLAITYRHMHHVLVLLDEEKETDEANVDRLASALELMLRGTDKDCNQVRMPSNEAVRAAFAAIDAARKEADCG